MKVYLRRLRWLLNRRWGRLKLSIEDIASSVPKQDVTDDFNKIWGYYPPEPGLDGLLLPLVQAKEEVVGQEREEVTRIEILSSGFMTPCTRRRKPK